MSRGPKKWTDELIADRQRQGFGQGNGAAYKPWIGARDFSSRGLTRRAYSPRLGRVVELFSDVEWSTFLLLEWVQDIADIREQFPLDRELTLEIAAALGIRHPCYPGTRVPVVMTVDLLVTRIRSGDRQLEAFDCKRTGEADDARSIEKLEIARNYFAGMDTPHHLVFHSNLPMTKVRNIEWIRGGLIKDGEQEIYQGVFEEHAQLMTNELSRSTRNHSLQEYCRAYDRRHGLEVGTGLRIARLLMHRRVIIPDLENPDLSSAPLASFHIAALPGQLRQVGGK